MENKDNLNQNSNKTPQPPTDVKSPELASKANASDNVVPIKEKKVETNKKAKAKMETILDVGPVKKKANFKKIGKILGLIVLSIAILIGIYVGYQYFISLTPEEIPEEKIRRTRNVEERKIEEDPSSLDILEKQFNDLGDQVKVMEADAKFENSLNLGTDEF